jgi:hypothetical protein
MKLMKQICLFVCLLAALFVRSAQATDYYVDCLQGSNGNVGDASHPWRTPLKVGNFSLSPGFAAGDRILLLRDCTWNSTLTISAPSTGASGNPIVIDSYSSIGVPGAGQPPRLTGYRPIAGSSWGSPTGNKWASKPLFDDDGTGSDNCPTDHNCVSCPAAGFTYSCLDQPMEILNFVLFGTIWGNKQNSTTNLTHDRDWFFDTSTQILYVYCTCTGGVSPDIYYSAVVPIAISNAKVPVNGGSTMLKLNNATWVHAQHLQMDWYDTYGVQVLGGSDHLTLANMVADSQVPNNTTPVGFYVHPSGTPSDIHIFNTDSHRNYVGYRFDGTASNLELKNCRAFVNRTYGIMDNTGGLTYSYCHLYANNLATGISTDVIGATDDGTHHNVPADTPPNIRGFMRYPARITLTYDDPGLVDGSHQYIQALLPTFQSKNVPLSIAVVTGYDLSQQLVSTFQSWINAGWDVNSHSVSHQYFTFSNAFTLRYTGSSASNVTLSIASKHLTITAPGDVSAQVSWDLTAPAPEQPSTGLDTLGGIVATLNQRGVFSVVPDSNMKSAVRSQDLADISSQNIKAATYTLQMDKPRLMTDELGWSLAWMNTNLTGLPSNRVYVYPGSFEDTSTEAIAVTAGYAGARGSGSMQPVPNAATVMATGINVQNILSQGMVPNFQNLTPDQFANKFRALVFKSAVWGVPFGIFFHVNELTPDQVGLMLDTLKSSGATLMTNTQLVNYILGTQHNSGTTYYADSATGAPMDLRLTSASPVIDQGATFTDEFKYDLLGIDQTQFGSGWEMGAFSFVPEYLGHAK